MWCTISHVSILPPITKRKHKTYGQAGLSSILGHLAELFVAPTDLMAPSSSSSSLINKLLAGEMERFRESVDSIIGSLSTVHLAYWHIRLLMKRHSPSSEPVDLLGPAEIIARILNSDSVPLTPLSHHFAALAAQTLVELVDIPDCRDAAWQGIRELQDALNLSHYPRGDETRAGWLATIRELLASKSQQQKQQQPPGASSGGERSSAVPNQGSLQHLADLAVGESENGVSGLASSTSAHAGAGGGAETGQQEGPPPQKSPTSVPEADSSDFAGLTRMGYLTALSAGGVVENGK